MKNSSKTLPIHIIVQPLANKLITNSGIQRAFFKEEVGDSLYYNVIEKGDLLQYFFSEGMMNRFVDKIANWAKNALDYEEDIEILRNKNNELQMAWIDLNKRNKKDISTLADKIEKNKRDYVKQIENKEKEIQKLNKENAELRAKISREQQERKDMANECCEILKKTVQKNKLFGVNNPQFKNNQIIITNKQQEGIVKEIDGLSKEIDYKSQLFNKNLPPRNRGELGRLLSENLLYKRLFCDQKHPNNSPMKNLSKKTKNVNSKINNNNNNLDIEESSYRS